jgi:hypothetical protein
MNKFFSISFFLSFLIWSIAPIRQIKGTYFLFFLALISGDIATIIARMAFHSNTNIFYVVFGLLCLISLQEKNISRWSKFLILVLCVISLSLEFHGLPYKQEFALISFLNFLLFLKFLKNFILMLVKGWVINFFLICLIFYELTAITKFLNLITGFTTAAAYFIATTSFEVLIGLFFCVFREDSPGLLVKLENVYSRY